MILFIVHAAVLFLAAGYFARRFYWNSIDRALALGAAFWANIVLTGLLLSLLHRLGNPVLFFRLSLVLAALQFFLSYRFGNGDSVGAVPRARPAASETNWLPVILFFLSIIPIALANGVVALSYAPNNYDSLTYHLPRVMFYLGQGSLQHFETENLRQIFFPFNLSLLHLALLQHGIGLQKLLPLLNVGFWIGAGLAIYRICRQAGHSMGASLGAAWVALISTQILAQATSTTNDLPTATAILAAVIFFRNWLQTRRSVDALMVAIALGLAFGSKLTAVFFIPPAVLLGGLLAYRHRQSITRVALQNLLKLWAMPAVAFVVLVAPFAIYNLAASGHWMTDQFDFTLNKPFSFAVFLQTAKAYTLQFFLEPLHRFTFDLSVTEALNRFAATYLFPDWEKAYAFSPFYFFPPDLNEDHVWFGFSGGFVLVAAVACAIRGWRRITVVTGLAILGIGWLLFYFALNKWSLYIQRYFVLAFLVMVPTVAYVFDNVAVWRAERSWSRVVVIAVLATSYWFALSYLAKNTNRPLLPLLRHSVPKPPELPVPGDIPAALAGQERVNMALSGGNERVFPLMLAGAAKAYTSSPGIRKEAFNLISKWALVNGVIYTNIAAKESYLLVPLRRKNTAGVEALGSVGTDVDEFAYFDLAANSEHQKSTVRNSNILFSLKYQRTGPERFISSRAQFIGLNPADRLNAKIIVGYGDGREVTLGVLNDSSEITLPIRGIPARIVVEVRSADGAELIGRGEMPVELLVKAGPREADPNSLSTYDLISGAFNAEAKAAGLADLEGPYPQYSLPLFRWAKQQLIRIVAPKTIKSRTLRLRFSVRLQVRESARLELLYNGALVDTYNLEGKNTWLDKTVEFPATSENDVIEFRDRSDGEKPEGGLYFVFRTLSVDGGMEAGK